MLPTHHWLHTARPMLQCNAVFIPGYSHAPHSSLASYCEANGVSHAQCYNVTRVGISFEPYVFSSSDSGFAIRIATGWLHVDYHYMKTVYFISYSNIIRGPRHRVEGCVHLVRWISI